MEKQMLCSRDVFFIIMSFILLYFPIHSNAETPFSPVTLATGRAGVATNEMGMQILTNPAALIHAPAFASGIFYTGGMVAESERYQNYSVTLVDNGDDVFTAGAFLYSSSQKSFQNLEDFDEQMFQISFGGFIYRHLSMGININHFRISLDDDTSFMESSHRFWDYDLGLLWNPIPDFAFGVLYEGIANHSASIPVHMTPQDRFTAGVNYLAMEQFRLRADLTRLTEKGADFGGDWDIRAGLESYVDAWLVLRMGFESENSKDREFISAGFGFTGPRLNVDYAYRKNTDFNDGALHSVDFRLPF